MHQGWMCCFYASYGKLVVNAYECQEEGTKLKFTLVFWVFFYSHRPCHCRKGNLFLCYNEYRETIVRNSVSGLSIRIKQKQKKRKEKESLVCKAFPTKATFSFPYPFSQV